MMPARISKFPCGIARRRILTGFVHFNPYFVVRKISWHSNLNGDSFFVEAALKFRIDKNNGSLELWYELQQIHNVMEQAARGIADTLQQAFEDLPIYYGEPSWFENEAAWK